MSKKPIQMDRNGYPKFGMRDKVAYAAGDFGCNMSFALKGTVQTFWLAYMMLETGLLSALLLGDEGFVHVGWKGRLAAGVTAGGVTVLCRLVWGVDGSAVGVLAAGLLTPVLHVSYHGLCRLTVFLREKFAKTAN